MAKRLLLILLILSFFSGFSQPVSSFQQFTGSYDFTMSGNTLNSDPNETGAPCTILTQSSANLDRKSTRLNSRHVRISYAVFCLKKKKNYKHTSYKKQKNKNNHNNANLHIL